MIPGGLTALALGGGVSIKSADFDGTNDYLRKVGALAGIADSKVGTFSGWFRLDGGDGTQMNIVAPVDTNPLEIDRRATNKFRIRCSNSASSVIFNVETSTAYTAGATWLHLLASWDLAVPGARSLYMNDVSDLVETTFIDDTIDYTQNAFPGWKLFEDGGGSLLFNGCVAEFYFNAAAYMDFSVEANRRKFISATGRPVDLGTDGSLPTGAAPNIYLSLRDAEAASEFAVNRGSGEGFTLTGTLTVGSTSP